MSDLIHDTGHSPKIPRLRQSLPSIAACLPSSIPEPDELLRIRRALSNTYMREASGGHLSRLGQADAAFDAGYLAILVVLGPTVPIGYERHTDPLLIQAAVATLNLPEDASDEALSSISLQYEPDYSQRLDPAALPNWARLIRTAANIECSLS